MPPKASKKASGVWYDKHRKCEDGSRHEGMLELITWNGTDDDGDRLGWGAVWRDEADEHKERFETKYGGDEEKFYDFWPQGFRWTCCGCSGDNNMGCDHHGSGSTPCRCDFCVMGKAVPLDLCPPNAQARKGLKLQRGPDPRSYNPVQASISAAMRGMLGMDTPRRGAGGGGSDSDSESSGGQGGGGGGAGSSSSNSGGDRGGSSSQGSKAKAQPAKAGAKEPAAAGAAAKPAAAAAKPTAAAAEPESAAAAACKACHVCGKEEREGGGSLFRCGGCKAVRYCSTGCQASHWPGHRGACRKLREQGQRRRGEEALAA